MEVPLPEDPEISWIQIYEFNEEDLLLAPISSLPPEYSLLSPAMTDDKAPIDISMPMPDQYIEQTPQEKATVDFVSSMLT